MKEIVDNMNFLTNILYDCDMTFSIKRKALDTLKKVQYQADYFPNEIEELRVEVEQQLLTL